MLVAFMGSAALSQPLLRITSPHDGTVVHPGDVVKVTVEAPSSIALEGVGLIATFPIDNSVSKGPPFELSVTVPTKIEPGDYTIMAAGMLRPGELSGIEKKWGRSIPSAPVTLIVERADDPIRLELFPPSMRLQPGRKGFLSVTGVFADGETVDLKFSSKTVYRSDAPEVVSVDAKGVVNALAPGTAKITISNGKTKVQVQVVVSNAARR
jgi:hypothetical protein